MKIHIINSAKNILRVLDTGSGFEKNAVHLNSGSIISATHIAWSQNEKSVNIHLKDGSVLVEVPLDIIKTDEELTEERLPKGLEASSGAGVPEYKSRRGRCCGG
tara:strand:- start:241 stop:552 length:312 start_codon:yes stop_codon:yes gene_type:complete